MKKLIEFIQRVDWKSIPKSVYLRYIAMIVVILNTVLTRLGINPIEVSSEAIYQNLSDTVTILILLMNIMLKILHMMRKPVQFFQ